MLTDVDGVRVGHWTDTEARTGCTVIVLPPGSTASGEIRGGAPATREFSVLDPLMMIQHIDAVVLSGGSAFGLSAGDGVMSELEQQGRGFATSVGVVPIVVGMSLFDLAVGDASVRPGPDQGAEALRSSAGGPYETGQVGAGTGATTNKWGGADGKVAGGLGTATERHGDLVVSALFAVNAFGAIDEGGGDLPSAPPSGFGSKTGFGGNTTIGMVVTNAVVDKIGCHWLAQSAHDGLSRSLLPAHTHADGDGVVAAATGKVEANLFHLRALAQSATTKAITSVASA